MALRYLFRAHLSDGTTIEQTPEDVSATHPSKSTYYDVAQRLSDVVRFELHGEHVWSVDLVDGTFELDGTPFRAEPCTMHNQVEGPYTLVYFRDVTAVWGQEPTHNYRFGWSTLTQEQTLVVS